MSEQQVLAKGFYRNNSIEGFISVWQYMFVRREGKKYLLLRFTNDLKFTVDRLELTVIQLASDGRQLGSRSLKLRELNAKPESIFAPSLGVEVKEECTDFRVKFISAVSGPYRYKVKGNRVLVYYKPQRSGKYRMAADTPDFLVRPRAVVQTKAAAVLALLLTVVGFFVMAGIMSYIEYRYEKSLTDGLYSDIASVEAYDVTEAQNL